MVAAISSRTGAPESSSASQKGFQDSVWLSAFLESRWYIVRYPNSFSNSKCFGVDDGAVRFRPYQSFRKQCFRQLRRCSDGLAGLLQTVKVQVKHFSWRRRTFSLFLFRALEGCENFAKKFEQELMQEITANRPFLGGCGNHFPCEA